MRKAKWTRSTEQAILQAKPSIDKDLHDLARSSELMGTSYVRESVFSRPSSLCCIPALRRHSLARRISTPTNCALTDDVC